jgi:hypothetical protein
LRLQLISPSTSPNELNTTLTPHSMIHGDACSPTSTKSGASSARGGIGTFRVGSYRRERTMTFDLAKARKLAETAVILKNEFMKTANWRREQAIDYPDDRWNFEAVVLLERLANTVDEIDPRLLEAYVGLWEGDGLSGAETQSEMLRGVAFTWAPQTASEFVSEFISKMTSGT